MSDDDPAMTAAGIPLLAGFGGPVERLGGLTNRVYRLGGHCLRMPGKGTEEYINRANEAVAAREAAKAGVSPEVLYFDARTGVMVTRFVDGAETMSPETFRLRAGAPGRAGQAFRKLHDSGAVFPFRFELFAMIDGYLKVLSTKDVALPDGYDDVVREADQSVRAALAAHELPLAACHCDPLCENFLDTGDRMWIVDWEYAGMNDPMWDLGDLSVEAKFDTSQEEEMIRAYFGARARRQRARPHRHLQGDVRPAVDAMGPDPARQCQPGRRFLDLCERPFRPLQGDDGNGRVFRPCRGRRQGLARRGQQLVVPVRRGRGLAFEQHGIAELVRAIAARGYRRRDALEHGVVGKGAQQLEMAFAGLVDAGQDRIDDVQSACHARCGHARRHARRARLRGWRRPPARAPLSCRSR